jgi:hypothetical protein
MKSIGILRLWRLWAFCLFGLLVTFGVTMASDQSVTHRTKVFWVSHLGTDSPSFRLAKASLRATGNRSLIYVEDKIWGGELTPDFLSHLQWRLEVELPAGALVKGKGLLPFEESLFGPLPSKRPGDNRLIVLFADLGRSKGKPRESFFNDFDQLTDAEARTKYRQRSNEANIVYVNGFRKSALYTTGLVAHELQRLLEGGRWDSQREAWLSETLAQGAMLLSGLFTQQPQVNELAKNPENHPLVTLSQVSRGPQLLFSSFLIDTLSDNAPTALSGISEGREPGKAAVERAFLEQTGLPLTFDAIFSNFISYVFGHSGDGVKLPQAWSHDEGISIPAIEPYHTFPTSSGELLGEMHPYSFLAIQLAQELSPSVLIQTERRKNTAQSPGAKNCAEHASVLWKPITPDKIALYSIGCDPELGTEKISFRLKILDRPSLLPVSPFKILPW